MVGFMAIDAASTPCLECKEPLFERRHAETSGSMIWTLAVGRTAVAEFNRNSKWVLIRKA
jgi:hypothetical protein